MCYSVIYQIFIITPFVFFSPLSFCYTFTLPFNCHAVRQIPNIIGSTQWIAVGIKKGMKQNTIWKIKRKIIDYMFNVFVYTPLCRLLPPLHFMFYHTKNWCFICTHTYCTIGNMIFTMKWSNTITIVIITMMMTIWWELLFLLLS